MSRSKKLQLCIVLTSFLLISCQASTISFTPSLDVQLTKAAATVAVNAQKTELAAIWTPMPELSPTHPELPTPEPYLTSTLFPTASPFPPTIASLLGTRCERFGESVYNQFISLYGDKGCKLPMLSPDGNYLAYVTLARQEDGTGVYFVDAVRILKVGTNENDKEVYRAHKMNYIGSLEWNPTGQLIIWEYIWEGPWVISVYDPVKDAVMVRMRLGEGGVLHWNPQHSAFYAVHTGEYGADGCVGELGGYDFQSGEPFPDLYKVFNMQERADDPFGIPYGKSDNLRTEPFSWSQDGKQLWLTVTPLYWQGDQAYEYEVGPKQAGVLGLSSTGVTYTSLAENPSLDYSFEGLSNPKIVSMAYQPRLCP